MNYFNKGKVFM